MSPADKALLGLSLLGYLGAVVLTMRAWRRFFHEIGDDQ